MDLDRLCLIISSCAQEEDVIGVLSTDDIGDLKPLGDRILIEVNAVRPQPLDSFHYSFSFAAQLYGSLKLLLHDMQEYQQALLCVRPRRSLHPESCTESQTWVFIARNCSGLWSKACLSGRGQLLLVHFNASARLVEWLASATAIVW